MFLKIVVAFGLFLMSSQGFSQYQSIEADFQQSSPGLPMRIMETPRVRIIFPAFLEDKANSIANLIEHYAPLVKVGDDQVAEQLTLVLRPEMAMPNGFVTLAPRRSEWFTPNLNIALLSGLDFDQTLSIHEYRHVMQFDFFNQNSSKFAYYLAGEKGQQLATAINLPPWFFEGDAVWAETVLTDAGRGRSARFQARMKALLTSGQIPSYDAFLAGTYTTNYPDHYVYGYLLVSRAYRIYGKDIWQKILVETSQGLPNPYKIYSAFKTVTGKDFSEFYSETMQEAAQEWLRDFDKAPAKPTKPFQNVSTPIVDGHQLYTLEANLDSFWGLYVRTPQGRQLIHEFDAYPSYSRVDVKSGKMVYTSFVSDYRFGYRTYSELFVYDIRENRTRKILANSRVYQPQFSPDGKTILVTEADDKSRWFLSAYDLDGKLQWQRSFGKGTINEAVWKDAQTLYAILQDHEGYKSLIEFKPGTGLSKSLMGRTRNTLNALRADGERLYFEADFKGKVQIFELNGRNQQLSRCTDEPIGAFQPFVHRAVLHYVAEVASGRELLEKPLGCVKVADDSLLTPVSLPYPAQTLTRRHPSEEYAALDGGLTPHSWAFFAGRGLRLSADTANYLNTFKTAAAAGIDSEERTPYAQLQISYSAYIPVFSIKGAYEQRNPKDEVTKEREKFDESRASLMVTTPYTFQCGLFEGSHRLGTSYGFLATRNDHFQTASGEYQFEFLKQRRWREITSSLGLNLQYAYRTAVSQESSLASSWQQFNQAKIYLPGLFVNNTMTLEYSSEQQQQGTQRFRPKSYASEVNKSVFSRGFEYEYVDLYRKGSYEYIFPVGYPDFSVWDWIYFKQIYSTLFYDYTQTEDLARTRHLKSTGLGLSFESFMVRKLPLTFRLDTVRKLTEDKKTQFLFSIEGKT